MQDFNELRAFLELEKIEDNLYRGQSYRTPWGRVFGGQVLAQSIHAAQLTTPDYRVLHSMHAYFLLAGDIDLPIVYDVERVRDGGSYTTRRVKAIQKGRTIFSMEASFQIPEDGPSHHLPMPEVPPPETLQSDREIGEALREQVPELYRLTRLERPIECRPTEGATLYTSDTVSPSQNIWIKACGSISASDRMHQVALAYVSDYNLLATALLPHRKTLTRKRAFLASLDHAMWFHRPFRMDDWLLYSIESPSASSARGFSRGSVFTRQGELVASVAQEGLIRYNRD
ncbi:acyl-CoA thioesterase II [Chromatiales bacterium (ex Bugula neritina AB1)]|nr:acyl-CoA thioesterase II [Chromatiales bacterium (ex Bugula neritina AB1)]